MSDLMFHLLSRQGLPHRQSTWTLIDSTGSLDEVAGELAACCTNCRIGEWLTSVFDPPLTKEQQMTIIQPVIAHLEGAEWRAPSPVVYGKSKLAFSAHNDGTVMIGIWDNSQTLLIGSIDIHDWMSGGIAAATVSHWHPESVTSGGYSNALLVLTETTGLSTKGLDEGGMSMHVYELDATTPQKIAEILTARVNGWEDMTGHGIDLMAAYLLGFSEGDVGLVGGEKAGYEIARLDVSCDAAVLKALREKYPTPSPSEAAAWLELAQSLCEDFDEYNELVENLTEIAQGGDPL